MRPSFATLEQRRLALQGELDAVKTGAERNKLGQFATPTELARSILKYAAAIMPAGERVRFLDPAIGTGAFYSALRHVYPNGRVGSAAGFEIDPDFGRPAQTLWKDTGLEIRLGDFTRQKATSEFNLVICNPPYVRHHHLTNAEKARLQRKTASACGSHFGGLAGLYCHFLGLAHPWMAEGAIAGWLIPSEFMDVNYGQAVKRYLLKSVTLLHIHRFDPNDVQFADALVSSAVVWFRKSAPPADHSVRFTFGGSLTAPRLSRMVPAVALAAEAKWTRFPAAGVRAVSSLPTISDFFRIKRGLATGCNSFFILSDTEIGLRKLPMEVFRPILPSPRHLPADVIEADECGNPVVGRRLFLLDPRLNEGELRRRHPTVWTYLREGKELGIHERYLCRHRTPWYAQEDRPAPPIVCTYLGRGDSKNGHPFRFIRNRSRATVANVFLAMYPTPALQQALSRYPALIDRVWRELNRISIADLLHEGRVYGGGLHKLEPKELANVPIPALAEILSRASKRGQQRVLFPTGRG